MVNGDWLLVILLLKMLQKRSKMCQKASKIGEKAINVVELGYEIDTKFEKTKPI